MGKEEFTELAKKHLTAMEGYKTDEEGNYKIEIFGFENLYEALNMRIVSHRRELLLDFLNVLDINNLLEPNIERITIDDIDEYLKI